MKEKYFSNKRWLVALIGCVVFIFSSCKYSNSPESVATKFLISFNQLDLVAAKSLSTPNTWELLDIMGAATKNISDERKKDFGKNFSVEILKTKKESDSTMIVTFRTKPKRLPFNQFRLLKTKNKDGDTRWKVDISTLDLLNSDSTGVVPVSGLLNPQMDTSGSDAAAEEK